MKHVTIAKARSDLVALIHGIYGLGWLGVATASGLPIIDALVLLAALIASLAASAARLSNGGRRLDPGNGRKIRKINLVTAIVAVAIAGALHLFGPDRLIVPAILLVIAAHFVPLWRLLERPSLAWMALSLAAAGLVGLMTAEAFAGPALAALAFTASSCRSLSGRLAPES